jgi:hypothetical protein
MTAKRCVAISLLRERLFRFAFVVAVFLLSSQKAQQWMCDARRGHQDYDTK